MSSAPRAARARADESASSGAGLVERAASVIVEERRGRTASRQASLLEPEQEDDLEAPCAGPEQVDDRDTARLVAAQGAQGLPLERRRDVLARELADERSP